MCAIRSCRASSRSIRMFDSGFGSDYVPARSFLKVCCRRRAEQQVPQRRVRIWRKTSSHGMPSERPARA